jgi:hypothetical protein
MGGCVSTTRVKDVENNNAVLSEIGDDSTCSSSSVITVKKQLKSSLKNARNLSDVPSTNSTLSSNLKRPYINEPIRKLKMNYNMESSCQSKEHASLMATEYLSQLSKFCSTTDIDEDEYVGSLSSVLAPADSFDGLNKRSVDRYDIGLEVLKAKIHHGANAERLSTHGDRTALMFAVLAKDLDFIKKLVEMGVDVNQSNALGETALSLACEIQNEDIADYLRSQGALQLVEKNIR